MHLSSQEEYGLRCLVRVAREEGAAPVRIQDIATGEGLTPEYVAKLMRILRNGELVTSTRGASGGYHLKRPAADITLWEAIEVLGGPFFPDTFCESHPGSLRDCVHNTNCSMRALWRGVNQLLSTALSGISVADLLLGEEKTFAWLTRGALAGFETGAVLPTGRGNA